MLLLIGNIANQGFGSPGCKLDYMKKIVFSFTLLIFALNVFGQTTQNPTLSKDEYLDKSKAQKFGAWTLIVVGAAVVAIGLTMDRGPLVATTTSFGYGQKYKNEELKAVLITGGLLVMSGSIPLFFSSSKNKRKAAAISFNHQKVFLPRDNYFFAKNQPAITLKIRL